VSAARGLPAFTTARFSVGGRAEIAPGEIRVEGGGPVVVGYWLGGPDGRRGIEAGATRDAAARSDVAPDVAVKPPPPPPAACMAATKACPGASACCSGLVCGTTSIGRVCCGNYNMTCSRPGGEDCCGQLECVNNHCCLPETYACSGGSCCAGLVCGTTSLGRVCCGNSGAHCTRSDGCCGSLECVSGVCH
jgi:hypothetical protein